MIRNFHDRFIKSSSHDPEQAEREVVLNYLLIGILALSIVALIDTLLTLGFTEKGLLLYRVLAIVVSGCIVVALYLVARHQRLYKAVALIAVGFIMLTASWLALEWGIIVPTSPLLFALAIVMAGILINARSSLYTAGLSVLIVAVLQAANARGSLHPDYSWEHSLPNRGDVFAFGAIFFIIALVSWLFNRQMHLSLIRAQRSERALARQRDLLEVKVEKRARQLEAAQLEKMQEIYRFAELGRLSTALFHDLANYLTSVSVDIEGLSDKSHSAIMRRISQNVGHIDAVVQRVRKQIRGETTIEVFNLSQEIQEVIKIATPTAEQAHVRVILRLAPPLRNDLLYKGDVIRFRQVVLNLVHNAIEAYPVASKFTRNRLVTVSLSRKQTSATLEVTDHGIGIPKAERSKIFRPFYTTKEKGAGIGLFLVQQIVEQDFKGTLGLTSDQQGTTFSVALGGSYYARTTKP